jgi:hypothetical protein
MLLLWISMAILGIGASIIAVAPLGLHDAPAPKRARVLVAWLLGTALIACSLALYFWLGVPSIVTLVP